MARCLIPDFSGAIFSRDWKDPLWARFFTQGDLADALGLSNVHVNRTLQEDLRAAGLITLTKNKLTENDWEGLKALGEFDPTYLHQQPREAA